VAVLIRVIVKLDDNYGSMPGPQKIERYILKLCHLHPIPKFAFPNLFFHKIINFVIFGPRSLIKKKTAIIIIEQSFPDYEVTLFK